MRNFHKFIIFCFVGVVAFLIDWLFFNIFYLVGIVFIFSRIFSAGISMVFNFSVNRNFTFRARNHKIRKQVIKWLTVYFIAIFANISIGKFVLILLGENLFTANLAVFAGAVIAIPISFFGSLLWVFKKERINPIFLEKYI
jgi:putative flippase GtrA